MPNLSLKKHGNVFIITLSRGKVNAINEELVSEFSGILEKLEVDIECKSIIITGSGSFFSFGFDIPELLNYPRGEFLEYLSKFNNLVKQIFMYPKPVVSSINGHCIAGGCVLAMACDFRIMNDQQAKISINEINFGSTLFSSAVEILKYSTGERNAERIILSGEMYNAENALKNGMVDSICSKEQLTDRSLEIARGYSLKDSRAYESLKKISRLNTFETMKRYEKHSLREFTDVWYSEKTRDNLKDIKILD